ncbi:MAG TPA: helix-turn-helix domain-containing protein [archaeon]|nr:helix-turn-helix domain-containing protein [archaeon]
MVASQKTMDALKSVGLNKYERNIWVALLSRGSATAGELAEMSKVPRSRCYDVLESLSAKGFIMLQPGKPLKYVSLPPKEALERAKSKIMDDAKEAEVRMDNLSKSESVRELEKLHKDNIKTVNTDEMTGALKGRSAMLQHFGTMMKKARKNVKLITTETGLSEIAEQHSSHIKKMSERGVTVQILAPLKDEHSEIVKSLSGFAQIRSLNAADNAEKMAGRVFIMDGEEFVLGLTDDAKTHPTQDVAFWSQSGHVTSSLMEPMFNMLWKNAKAAK